MMRYAISASALVEALQYGAVFRCEGCRNFFSAEDGCADEFLELCDECANTAYEARYPKAEP